MRTIQEVGEIITRDVADLRIQSPYRVCLFQMPIDTLQMLPDKGIPTYSFSSICRHYGGVQDAFLS